MTAETCNEWLLADAGVSENEDILMGLYQKGWLQFDINQESYAMHLVFAQVIYEKCKPKAYNHSGMVEGCKMSIKVPKSGRVIECQWYIPFAQAVIKKFAGKMSKEYMELAEHLSHLLYYIAEYEKAEKWKKIIVYYYEKTYGEDHVYTANSYCNLAAVYENQGKLAEAEALYKKCIKIRETKLGILNPVTADGYLNLSALYGRQGNYVRKVLEYGNMLTEKIVSILHWDIIIWE